MNSQMKSRQLLSALVIALGVAGLCSEAHGQERFALHGPRVVLDARYHHDRYYPPRGYLVEQLPVGSVSVTFGPAQYFFHAGVWFHPVGARFEVVTPPIGIVVPLLPPGYVSLTIGGTSYYYANGVYYTPASGAGYTVVAPPLGAETAQPLETIAASPTAAAASSVSIASPSVREPIVYPRNGQTAAQTDADLKQCRQWAGAQPSASANASVLDRALDACLDGRGYTVR